MAMANIPYRWLQLRNNLLNHILESLAKYFFSVYENSEKTSDDNNIVYSTGNKKN
jgi:hypothetical protein